MKENRISYWGGANFLFCKKKKTFPIFIILRGGKHLPVFERRNCANLISNMHIFTVGLASVKWVLNYIITTGSVVLNGGLEGGGQELRAAPWLCWVPGGGGPSFSPKNWGAGRK